MADLDLPRDSRATALACSHADERLSAAGWSGNDASRVVLAVGEAVSNAVEHGPDAAEPIRFRVDADLGLAVVHVDDGGQGPAGDRIQHARLPHNPLSLGGRGLYIISQLADSVENVGPGTLVMRFRRRL